MLVRAGTDPTATVSERRERDLQRFHRPFCSRPGRVSRCKSIYTRTCVWGPCYRRRRAGPQVFRHSSTALRLFGCGTTRNRGALFLGRRSPRPTHSTQTLVASGESSAGCVAGRERGRSPGARDRHARLSRSGPAPAERAAAPGLGSGRSHPGCSDSSHARQPAIHAQQRPACCGRQELQGLR